jgi:hypothetical protein
MNSEKSLSASKLPIDKITVEEAFDRCGGVGRFQIFSAFINTIANAAAMFFFNAFAFLEVEPMFMCQMTPGSDVWTLGNSANNHLETEFCSGDYNCQINWDSRESIHNLIV